MTPALLSYLTFLTHLESTTGIWSIEGIVVGRLWKHRDFGRLWGGETAEWLTDSITTLAVPTIAILIFNAGPLEMGALNALGNVGYPVLGLFAGVMVDRWRRRPVLIWTNIIQAVALSSIPAAFFLRILSLYQLFIVMVVMSATTVLFNVAYTAYLPTLIARDDLVEGNSKLETSSSAAAVVGPPIAGALIHFVGAASSVALDALGTLIAAIAILSIRNPEPPPSPAKERRFWIELREGVSVVGRTRTLRNLAASTSVLNIGNTMFLAVFYLYIYDQLKLSPAVAGITLGIGALGVVVGAVIAPKLLKTLGLGPALTAALLINGLGLLAVRASVYGPAALLLAPLWLVTSIGIPVYNINQVSFRQLLIADNLQGRMNATMRTFGYGAATLGALIGGVVGARYGILTAMTAGGLIAIVAAVMIGVGPVGRVHEMPQISQPPVTSPEGGLGEVVGGGFLTRLKTRLESTANSLMGTSLRGNIPSKLQSLAACSQCGIQIMRATRFCQSCGVDFGQVVCSCGRGLGLGARFCDRCGREVWQGRVT